MQTTQTNAPDWRGNIEDAAVIYNLLKDKHASEVGMPAWVLFQKVVRYLEIYAPERMDK